MQYKISGSNRAKKLDKRKARYTGSSFSKALENVQVNNYYSREPKKVIESRIKMKGKRK
jgi:hypothetical protein